MAEGDSEREANPGRWEARKWRGFIAKAWRGEVTPDKPPAQAASPELRWFLWVSLAIVVGAIAVLELTYSSWPVPPGVDSGDWIQRSFGWVGLAHPPMDAVGSPFLYSPLIFPMIGGTELLTGSPITTGFLFGGLLLAAYGLSVIHLSRHFLLSGPFQVLFVGLAVLNGTTLQILFWGGYPNFLAFVFFNEGLVFLLAFARTRSTRDGLLLYAIASLLFLTHELTFVLFLATLLTTALFLLAQDRRWLGVFLSRANVMGLVILGITVGGYIEITKHLGIESPGYFSANPAAYVIDNIGEVFRPLGSAPLLLPMGPGVYLTPVVAMAVLLSAGLVPVVFLALARRRWPDKIHLRHFIAVAVLVGACVPPVLGYLVRVDTDYTRFAYFFGLPVALLLSLSAEAMIGPRSPALVTPTSAPRGVRAGASLARKRPSSRELWTLGGVVIVLLLVATNVTIPVAISNEQANAGTTHDASFLDMTRWLSANPQAGSVLTTQGAVRWVEALTDRGAFDVGPTWLLFEPWQIVNAEESYWALNAEYALTNNLQVFSFSGFNASVPSGLVGSPTYAAYIEGIQFPLLRLVPTSTFVYASDGGSFIPYPLQGPQAPELSFSTTARPSALVTYPDAAFTVNETTVVVPGGGAWLNFTFAPKPGDQVSGVNLTLSSPSLGPSLLHTPASQGVGWAGSTLFWNNSGPLGQLPGSFSLTSRVSVSPTANTTALLSNASVVNSASLMFTNPTPSRPLEVSLSFQTDGASNPAASLPALMSGPGFLSQHDIHFLVVPNQVGFTATTLYFESVHGFRQAFSNTEWVVLQG